jgi:1,2-dihydroxy-3-keto-5-methylthiopentene dioxygenase
VHARRLARASGGSPSSSPLLSKKPMSAVDAHAARLAAPDDVAMSKLQAWVMSGEDHSADPRLPHRCDPDQPVSPAELAALGVVSWHLPPGTEDSAARLAAVRAVRGYTYQDEVTVGKGLTQDYEAKLAMFFREHIHADEEVRYVTRGSGYFDVRRERDGAWLRVHTCAGNMIVLPAGLYHRFTLDVNDYVVAQRLFVGEPVWTPINRGPEAEDHPARKTYLRAQSV